MRLSYSIVWSSSPLFLASLATLWLLFLSSHPVQFLLHFVLLWRSSTGLGQLARDQGTIFKIKEKIQSHCLQAAYRKLFKREKHRSPKVPLFFMNAWILCCYFFFTITHLLSNWKEENPAMFFLSQKSAVYLLEQSSTLLVPAAKAIWTFSQGQDQSWRLLRICALEPGSWKWEETLVQMLAGLYTTVMSKGLIFCCQK